MRERSFDEWIEEHEFEVDRQPLARALAESDALANMRSVRDFEWYLDAVGVALGVLLMVAIMGGFLALGVLAWIYGGWPAGVLALALPVGVLVAMLREWIGDWLPLIRPRWLYRLLGG